MTTPPAIKIDNLVKEYASPGPGAEISNVPRKP